MRRRGTHRLIRRVGRRGAFLLFLAGLDFLFGTSLLHPPTEILRSPATRYVADIAPLPAWGGLWVAVGITCLIGAFLRSDRWAYVCAAALKVLWGSIYLFGWIVWLTNHHTGLDRGWVSAALWLTFAAVTMFVIAPWPEADNRRQAVIRGGR